MSLKIKNNWDKHITRQNASKMHKEVFSMLRKKFRLYKIKQEYDIIIYDSKNIKHTLFLDFFIPELSFAIECQGKQHLEHNAFFDTINGKRGPESSAQDSMNSVLVCHAAIKSWQTGQKIDIKPLV